MTEGQAGGASGPCEKSVFALDSIAGDSGRPGVAPLPRTARLTCPLSLIGLPGQILPGPGVQLSGLPLRPGPELRHAGEPAAAGGPQPALPRLRQWAVMLSTSRRRFLKTHQRGLWPPLPNPLVF